MFAKSILSAVLASAVLSGSSIHADDKIYYQTVKVPKGASFEEVLELSTRVVPHERQKIWHKDEFISFIHFGPNTFTRSEWGSGREDPKIFNPSDLDTDQWCDVMKKAGITRVILTVKHHDGYCLYPSRYVKHSVESSTDWRNGKGDVLADLAKSCKKYGLKLGVYLSPADRYMKNTKMYGNGSKIRKEVVPTPVEGRPFADKRKFEYELDDYNLYFMNQLYELLTEYGTIYEVWFDGAAASGNTQKYNRKAWFDMIHQLAPNAMIAVKGPDTRWCGNESGGTRESEFNIAGLKKDQVGDEEWNDNEYANQSRNRLEGAKYLHYYPAETNTSIRHGWFYRDDEHQFVRSADDVFDIYERSVGGNTVFLLNIPPNREGKFSERDVNTLIETGKRIREVYGKSLSESATGPKEVLDGNEDTYWQAKDITDSFEIKLPAPVTTNRIVLQEALFTKGQRVEKHNVEAWIDGEWKELSSRGAIGYKRFHRFRPVTSDRFRVNILESRAPATISRASIHFYDEPPNPVQIKAKTNNQVSIASGVIGRHGSFSKSATQNIHYTLDGSEPTAKSPLYKGSFNLEKGGIIKARTIVDGRLGVLNTQILGYPKSKWKAIDADSVRDPKRNEPRRAIDGTSHSWSSEGGDGEHFITIDMGDEYEAAGFTYLPPNDKKKQGFVEKYRFEGSSDGKNWKVLKEGSIDNIINDPSERKIYFDTKQKFRYFKLVCVKPAQGNRMAIQEISILSEKL